jgi:hypothetical protein
MLGPELELAQVQLHFQSGHGGLGFAGQAQEISPQVGVVQIILPGHFRNLSFLISLVVCVKKTGISPAAFASSLCFSTVSGRFSPQSPENPGNLSIPLVFDNFSPSFAVQ